jgi:hypothetical protein
MSGVFCELFIRIIINQLLSQVNNIRFFYFKMVFSVEHETFLIESYFPNGTKVGGVWLFAAKLY